MLLGSILLTGCGWATGGVAGLTGGSSSGGGGNATPTVSDVSVSDTRTSPATIRYTLSDNESNSVSVQLFYRVSGGPPVAIRLPEGGGRQDDLPTSQTGVVHTSSWDFATQLGASFLEDVTVEVHVLGESPGTDFPDPIIQSTLVDLGNDPPSIASVVAPAMEAVGIVPVDMIVSDSSSDLVTVRLSYDLIGDDPDLGFRAASLAGQAPPNILATPTGSAFTFFWDAIEDTDFSEHDVTLRLQPFDGDLEGAFQEAPVRIDNNSEPIAVLNSANFVLNPDTRRGIPLAFEIIDGDEQTGEAAQEVTLVFQWRRANESFKNLPSGIDEIEAILADPTQRAEFQIATERPLIYEGQTAFEASFPSDDSIVRLPELSSSASALVERGENSPEIGLNQELEIFRSSETPFVLDMEDGSLTNVVASLPTDRGISALALEALDGGGWQIRQVDLTTGNVMSVFASDPNAGTPTTMTFETKGETLLVASNQGPVWQVQRVTNRKITDLISADGSTEMGEARGIASLGETSALLTVGNSLLQLNYVNGQPATATELFSPSTGTGPLQTPWGVVLNPLDKDQVIVAENGANRILSISLGKLTKTEVVANGIGFPSPQSIAFDRSGARLLVVTDTDPGDGENELRGIEINDAADIDADGLADREVFELLPGTTGASNPVGEIGSVATDQAGVRLVTLSTQGNLAVGGGVEQVRTIIAYEPTTQIVRVSQAFDPPFEPATARKKWRIVDRLPDEFQASPQGAAGIFVWDSTDLPEGGGIVFRLVPFDTEIGIESRTREPKTITSELDGQTFFLGDQASTPNPESVVTADLDGDGDLDIVSANSSGSSLTVFFQTNPAEFTPGPILVTDESSFPQSVATGDLDGDGDLDIISANRGSFIDAIGSSITLFFQTTPGEFSPGQILGDEITTPNPVSVATGDLDNDGDLDFITANSLGSHLTLFFQTSPGLFALGRTLGDSKLTSNPGEVTLADLDRDGDLDIISANLGFLASEDGNNLSIFKQTTPGEFALAQLLGDLTTTGTPVGVETGDFDGDGDLDIVSANDGTSNLTIFAQTDGGSFELATTVGGVSITPSPTSVTAEDFDGDDDLDLIVTNTVGGKDLVVFLQVEPGDYRPGPSLGQSSSSRSVATADFDGDGRLDVVIANSFSNNLTVALNSTAGSFTPGLILGNGSLTDAPFRVVLADCDQDGDLDIVSANSLSSNLAIFFQTTPGSFTQTSKLGDETSTSGTRSVAAGDIDGDGDIDLVSANTLSDTLSIFVQTSPGEFLLGQTIGGPGMTVAPISVAIADLDSDGDLDIVSGNGRVGGDAQLSDITLFFQTAPLAFTLGATLGGNGSTPFPNAIATDDLDQDGDIDIATANTVGNNITLFFQASPGVFVSGPVLGDATTTLGPQQLITRDFNSDGKPDILSANSMSNNMILFFQVSPGMFTQGPTIGGLTTTFGIQSVTSGDLDLDGDLDLVVPNGFINTVRIFTQISPGTFLPGKTLDIGAGFNSPFHIAVGDLDGDGDPDIVSANLFGDSLSLFFNAH